MHRSSSSPSILCRHVARTAACNSSLGMLVNFTGAFQAFPMMNEQWVGPFGSSILRYAHAPYPISETSEKMCSCNLHLNASISGGKYLSGIHSSDRDDWVVQDLHRFKKCSSNGWSQSSLAFQRGPQAQQNQKGHTVNRQKTENRIPCLLSGQFKFLFSKPSSSVWTNQWTPRTLSTGNSSRWRLRSGNALLSTGIGDMTSLLLDMN